MPVIDAPLKQLLQEQIRLADTYDHASHLLMGTGDDMIEIPTSGQGLASVYEQLRNAAEHSEEHLLLQRAIKRFYQRNLSELRSGSQKINTELIAELVLADYIKNGSVSQATVSEIDTMTMRYAAVLAEPGTKALPQETTRDWALACLSTDVEKLLNPHNRERALLAVTYQNFLRRIDRTSFAGHYDEQAYELCLYIAIHQAILKSDRDSVRADIRVLYGTAPEDVTAFFALNRSVDGLVRSDLTAELRRIVNANGAPFRVLKSMLHQRADLDELLDSRTAFLDAFRVQTATEYVALKKRLDVGLAKSIAFIFITKMLIGVGIEVPYDMLRYGSIAWAPLLINLASAPVYMALLRLGVTMPRQSHAEELTRAIDDSLYGQNAKVLVIPRKRQLSHVRQLVYTVLFAVPIALVFAGLYALEFNIVQMVIFFIFISTASSLAFRLNAGARELEISHPSGGFMGAIRDFIQMPFIIVGQWLSSTYQQFNIISRLLDTLIELPLKTVLRLIRQWVRFFDEQRERLY